MNPFVSTFSILILTIGLLTNVENANAQSNSTQYDMKSITDNLNKSITKLTGTNSSDLLKDTLSFYQQNVLPDSKSKQRCHQQGFVKYS